MENLFHSIPGLAVFRARKGKLQFWRTDFDVEMVEFNSQKLLSAFNNST